MFASSRSILFGVLFALACLCFSSQASAIPVEGTLSKRDYDGRICSYAGVQRAVKLFSQNPTISKKVCDKVLHRSVQGTSTVTRKTTSTKTETSTGTKTKTVRKGTKTVVATKRVQKAEVKTATSTVVSTITTTSTSTTRTTSFDVKVTTLPVATTTITTTLAAIGRQRKRATSSFKQKYPELPNAFNGVDLADGINACLCWSKPQIVKTVFVTVKVTQWKTVMAYKTKTVTVPEYTKTSTKTVVSTAKSTKTVKVNSISTVKRVSTTTIKTTLPTTSTSTPPAATETSPVYIYFSNSPGSFNSHCYYSGWTAEASVNPSPDSWYSKGLYECGNLCVKQDSCHFFNVVAYAQGSPLGEGAMCHMFPSRFQVGEVLCDESVIGSEIVVEGR